MLISQRGQKVLKVIHLLTVSYWIGGAFAVLTLLVASGYAQSSDELFGFLRSIRFVSLVVVVYMGAYASFFTGLTYSICTNRGFVRHKWIILKWAMTLYMIVVGLLWLGPWSTRLLEMALELGIGALQNPDYLALRDKLLIFESIQVSLLFLATVLSVYRPWEERENAARYGLLQALGRNASGKIVSRRTASQARRLRKSYSKILHK